MEHHSRCAGPSAPLGWDLVPVNRHRAEVIDSAGDHPQRLDLPQQTVPTRTISFPAATSRWLFHGDMAAFVHFLQTRSKPYACPTPSPLSEHPAAIRPPFT